MNKYTFKQIAKYGSSALVLAAVSTVSYAAPIDVTAVVSDITGTLGPIGLIGAAVLIVTVSIMAFKWVKRAM
jgi:protein-S-isoprenylcysteine O-methyltransferase Ste14